LFTVWDSAGWLICRRREAADNPPCSTIATNAASSRNSIAYGRQYVADPPCAELIAAVHDLRVVRGKESDK
jgi:hypothetical protein